MVLSVSNIRKNFGRKEVLKGISFSAESGRALGLLGRNGAGKTTTIRIIMGILLPDAGEIRIDGGKGVRIGYMPEERGLYPKTGVLDQMVYIGKLRGMSKADAVKRAAILLKRLEADDYAGKKLETLSKGNQQKIQLAISVINDPDIVILDEPFSGLDPVNAKLLKKLVEDLVSEGKVVLFSSHQMPYVEEFCQQVCIIDNGGIVLDGVLSDIKRSYPRNRLLITPEGGVSGFAARLAADARIAGMAKDIKSAAGESCIVTLTERGDKRGLLEAIIGLGFSPDGFRVIEPTLEEIFIEKAGALDA